MSVLLNAMRLSKRLIHCFAPNICISNRNFGRTEWISVTVVAPNGFKTKFKGKVGSKVLDMIRDNLIINDYGMCNGIPGCTTCHVIFSPEDYEKLSQPPDDLEKDLLRCTIDVTPTSRLGCQVPIEDNMDGMEIRLPQNRRDMREE